MKNIQLKMMKNIKINKKYHTYGMRCRNEKKKDIELFLMGKPHQLFFARLPLFYLTA